MGAFFRRLAAVVRRGRLERDLDDELAFHAAMRQGDVAPQSEAPPRFGHTLPVKEQARDAWAFRWVEDVVLAARHGLRSLRGQPAFAATVVLTLALGIGLTTAVFTVFRAVVMRPLDYPEPDRLIWLTLAGDRNRPGYERVSNLHVLDWEEQSTTFERFVAYNAYDQTFAVPGQAARARVAAVSQGFWDIAGVAAAVGRLPRRDDRDVVVLTHSFYTRIFSANPTAVGRSVTLDRRQVTVVGVLPPGFDFQLPTPLRSGFRTKDVDVYSVMLLPTREAKFVQFVNVVGRLKPNADLEVARAEIDSLLMRTPQRDPTFVGAKLQVSRLHDRLIRDSRTALSVLLVAVGFVSLVAFANVATLLVARASAREAETAVRIAIGASGTHLFRQHLIEIVVLIGCGAAAGLLVASWAVAAANTVSLGSIPRLSEAAIDSGIVGRVVMASALSAVALAVVPALLFRPSRITVSRHPQADTPRQLRFRHLIVTAQIAVALTLLTGAGLMVKSLWRLYDFPVGFEPDRILVMRADFPGQPSRVEKRTMTLELLRRVQALPGVTAASINSQGDRLSFVNVEGVPPAPPDTAQAAVSLNMTSAAFASVMGLRMVRGRWFTDAEPQPVIVINESLATRTFGRSDPLGTRLQIPSLTSDPKDVRFAPIVGVVSDLKYTKLDEAAPAEMYVPYTHLADHTRINLLVRTERNSLALVAPIRQVISSVMGGQVPFEVMTLADALTDSIRPRRFNLLLLATFAGIALLLTLVGIYGLVAYTVGQRTHEIGVRMALGARQGHVLGLVMQQGLRLTATGVCVGAAAAFALTRVMVNMLYEVAPTDPPTFVTTTVLVLLAALMACAVPAASAARVDPIQALRHE